jgi:hypothetical protein
MEAPFFVRASVSILMGVQIKISIIFPVEGADDLIHRVRVIVTEVIVVETGETGEVEYLVE